MSHYSSKHIYPKLLNLNYLGWKINFFLKLYIYIVLQLYYVQYSSIILPLFIIFYLTLASSNFYFISF